MNLSRREALSLGLAGSAAVLTAGCAQVSRRVAEFERKDPIAPPTQDVTPEVRLLNRAAFGPGGAELASLRTLGKEAWVDQQLQAKLDEPAYLRMQIHRLDVFRMKDLDLRDMQEDLILRQLQQGAILRAAYSPNVLEERMVDFWTNHFNIFGRKGWAAYRKGTDETKVIRANALGKFPAMLEASAKSPAMLAYLDNRFSRKGMPNENYAREIMELHTLGVNGGYTHRDIDEVARCFTGWTISTDTLGKGNFKFDAARHDDGEKIVLGQKIPAGGGLKDGHRVMEILCAHPATARHISGKICRYLLGDRADRWIEPTAKTFLETKGDIPAMIRPILLSDDLIESGPILKRPFDLMVSSLRATDALTDGGAPLISHLERMGQPLYQWPMPDGYPDKTSAWTGSLLSRWNFALAMASGQINGTVINHERLGDTPHDPLRVASTVLQTPEDRLSPTLRENLKDSEPSEALALCLASPDFQWR